MKIKCSFPGAGVIAMSLLLLASCKKGSSVANITCTVSTLAGSGLAGETNGSGSNASFSQPSAMTVDPSGNIFVIDSAAIREVTADGTVSSAAFPAEFAIADGHSQGGYYMNKITADNNGNLYGACAPVNQIFYVVPFKNNAGGTVYPFAGSILSQAGFVDGTAKINSLTNTALLTGPNAIAFDKSSGSLYFEDESKGDCIRKIAADGTVTHFVDGSNFPEKYLSVASITCDNEGNLYVADSYDSKIWKISPAGAVSPFVNAQLSITVLATDNADNVYATDGVTIWRFSTSGQQSFLAGNRTGSTNGPGSTASFSGIAGMAVDASGDIYVADKGNNLIRKIVIQ